jgi:hypothetical protein
MELNAVVIKTMVLLYTSKDLGLRFKPVHSMRWIKIRLD